MTKQHLRSVYDEAGAPEALESLLVPGGPEETDEIRAKVLAALDGFATTSGPVQP